MNGGTPVTVLGGALGAGKTTTLDHLLSNPGGVGSRCSSTTSARSTSTRSGSRPARTASPNCRTAVCICCDLRDELDVAVSRLAPEREFDHLVVEASGVSEPAPVARPLTTGPAAVCGIDSHLVLYAREREEAMSSTPAVEYGRRWV